MLEAYQSAIANQFEAAYCTLGLLVDGCPKPQSDKPLAKSKFCQVVVWQQYRINDLPSQGSDPFFNKA